MEIETYEKYYNMFIKVKPEEILNTCNHEICIISGMKTCINCGCVFGHIYVAEKNMTFRKQYHNYERSNYFKEKLLLIGGYKQCTKNGYNEMINFMKTKIINNIFDLKKLMRYKYSKFYKYIYNIYFDTTKVKAVQLSLDLINWMHNQYIIFEKIYKKSYNVKPNYTIVIFAMLKLMNYETKNLIISKPIYRREFCYTFEILKQIFYNNL